MELVGVARHQADGRWIDAQLFGHHLHERGEMPLSLGAHAGGHIDLARAFHLHPGALVRPDACAFHISDHADAHMTALGPVFGLLFLDEFLILDELQGLVQHRLVVAAVIAQRCKILIDDLVVVGEFVGRDEVDAADFRDAHPQLLCGNVQQAFHHENAVLATGAAVGRHDHLVGERDLHVGVVVGDVVAAQQGALAVDGHGQTVRIISTRIVDEFILDAQDFTVLAQCDFRPMDLIPLLGGGHEILAAILDPFDGPIELHRRPGQQHLFGVEHHNLGPERAADERRYHPHLRFGKIEHGRDAVADNNGRLGGVPHGQALHLVIPPGHDAPVLHGRGNAMIVVEPALDHYVGLFFGLGVVAFPLDDVRRQVGVQVFVDQRSIGRERFLQARHRGQRLDIHKNLLGRVLGDVAAFGDDHDDGFAHVAHLVFGQGNLGAGVEDLTLHRRRGHQ